MLDKAKSWEHSVRLCAQLRARYEKSTYEYTKLGWLRSRESELFTKMTSQQRHYPNYSRVSYHGQLFPEVCS